MSNDKGFVTPKKYTKQGTAKVTPNLFSNPKAKGIITENNNNLYSNAHFTMQHNITQHNTTQHNNISQCDKQRFEFAFLNAYLFLHTRKTQQ